MEKSKMGEINEGLCMNFNMKNYLILAFLSLSLIAFKINEVKATPVYLDMVIDSNGNSVLTGYGDCLRTKWVTDKDLCCCNCEKVAVLVEEKEQETITAAADIVIPHAGKVYFDFDKANIKDSEKPKLDEIAEVLKRYEIDHLHIYGFTDNIGTEKYNKILSEKRALAVFDYLKTKAEKLKSYSSEVDMKGFGKANPVKDCKKLPTKEAMIECLAPNRRVEVTVEYLDTIR
jgi:OOP family OmpA-OmpF porin